ncbi:uncharacterized protein LOC130795143 [Actinidia eriantha]|uniref:uncharacterized protein LOC130795143 n=1 Tax=Actinidia eriantha TaxID=165200 RepID=UPI00258D73E2|nr:uncharacterized protein LOC130795143 [Actinidia eriantha]
MGKSEEWGWPPTVSPPSTLRDDHWRHFDTSVNAVSFGFVATAVLISMFLVMAIFERFLRPNSPATSPEQRRFHRDVESQMGFNGKLRIPSPKSSVNAREISVLMPGEDIPTFIAHPAPVPCPPERVSWPTHQHKSLPSVTQDSDSSTSTSSI